MTARLTVEGEVRATLTDDTVADVEKWLQLRVESGLALSFIGVVHLS